MTDDLAMIVAKLYVALVNLTAVAEEWSPEIESKSLDDEILAAQQVIADARKMGAKP